MAARDSAMSELLVPVSPGELLDKITILRIKSARMTDPAKLKNVRYELKLLEHTWSESVSGVSRVTGEEAALQEVNERLWDIEDRIRDLERENRFDAEFVALARSVYIENDERAAIKKRINLALGAKLVEEKSYKEYR
jgi:hypothetical protein